MNKKILLIILIIISLLTSCVYIISENDIVFIEPVETLAQDQEMNTMETIKEPETETEPETKIEIEKPQEEKIIYPIEYFDSSSSITIVKQWFKNAWCYIAHLEFDDYTRFSSSVAKDQRGWYETTSDAAERLGAIFCINGPYNWGELEKAYAVIRNGIVHYDININEDLGIYNSATGKLENAKDLGISGKLASEVVSNKLATDTFKFWNSTLIKNGLNVSNQDNYSRAQRTFIATNGEAGNIYAIVSEGRYVDGESPGLTKNECAELLLQLGCTYGIMLDGGGSSTMVWNGEILNSAKSNERAVVDFVYFK